MPGQLPVDRSGPEAHGRFECEPTVEVAAGDVERETRPSGGLEQAIETGTADLARPAEACRGAVGVDQERSIKRFSADEDRTVAADLGAPDIEGVRRRSSGQQHETRE